VGRVGLGDRGLDRNAEFGGALNPFRPVMHWNTVTSAVLDPADRAVAAPSLRIFRLRLGGRPGPVRLMSRSRQVSAYDAATHTVTFPGAFGAVNAVGPYVGSVTTPAAR